MLKVCTGCDVAVGFSANGGKVGDPNGNIAVNESAGFGRGLMFVQNKEPNEAHTEPSEAMIH